AGCFLCTMSFVAYLGTTQGFVTNRHCTNVEGQVDGTHYWQALSHDGFVATEIIDGPFFTGDPCPAGKQCSYADTIFARADKKNLLSLGTIARSAGPD